MGRQMVKLVSEKLRCPSCGTVYDNGFQRFCDTDGARLMPAGSGSSPKPKPVFSPVVPSLKQPEPMPEQQRFEPAADDIVLPDDEIIRDAEMAELFREGSARVQKEETSPPQPQMPEPPIRIQLPGKDPRAARSPIRKVDPAKIPSAHINIDSDSVAHLNDFDRERPDWFVSSTVKGRYRVIEYLGEDAAGFQYVGEDKLANGRRVSLRILDGGVRDDIIATILSDERVALSHFLHPGIARVLDSGELKSGARYLISEHLDGLTAEDVLRIHGRLDPHRAARIIRNVAHSLSDVHDERLLHRDVRPAQIEIAADENGAETVRLVGFGVADGTPTPDNLAFTAPEVLKGGVVTVSGDIFSLGATAFELLSGEPPFKGKTVGEVLRWQKAGADTSVFPIEVGDVLAKALAFDPRSRFASAREFGEALYSAILPVADKFGRADARVEAGRAGDEATSDRVPVASVSAANVPAADGPAWTRRSPEPLAEPNTNWLKAAAVMFGIMLVLFAGVWYLLLSRPAALDQQPAANTSGSENTGAPSAGAAVDLMPEPRKISPPEDFVYFDNNKQKLRGDLFRNYVGFSLYYPKTWTVNGSMESSAPGTRGKFFDISSSAPDGKLREQMLISYFPSKGTFNDDEVFFPDLVRESSETLKKFLPGFQVVAEGPTVLNGGWKAYEIKFQGSGQTPAGERIVVWGRRIFVPAARPGVRNGIEITMLATSKSAEVTGVDDVGVKGELAQVLETFEPGRNY